MTQFACKDQLWYRRLAKRSGELEENGMTSDGAQGVRGGSQCGRAMLWREMVWKASGYVVGDAEAHSTYTKSIKASP